MSEQIVQCPGCGVKLKLKDDRVLPADAACPKCQAPLFQRVKPSTGPSSTRSNPSAPPARAAKRRPVQDELDEFEDVVKEEYAEARPRKRSRSKSRSSGGVPGWAIGAVITLLAVAVVVGVVLLLPRGETNLVAQQSTTPAAASPEVASPASGVATLSAHGAVSTSPLSSAAMVQTGQSASPATSAPPATPPVIASPAVIAAAPRIGDGPLAKYQPKPDSLHYYHFEVVSDLDDYLEKTSGSCMLTAQKVETSGFSVKRESQEAARSKNSVSLLPTIGEYPAVEGLAAGAVSRRIFYSLKGSWRLVR